MYVSELQFHHREAKTPQERTTAAALTRSRRILPALVQESLLLVAPWEKNIQRKSQKRRKETELAAAERPFDLNHFLLMATAYLFRFAVLSRFFSSTFGGRPDPSLDAGLCGLWATLVTARFQNTLLFLLFLLAGLSSGQEAKSIITLRDTWSRRQAGALRPVRRAGWVRAAGCAPAARSSVGWLLQGPPCSCLPLRDAMRRGAWK